jgi:hypothetical protein
LIYTRKDRNTGELSFAPTDEFWGYWRVGRDGVKKLQFQLCKHGGQWMVHSFRAEAAVAECYDLGGREIRSDGNSMELCGTAAPYEDQVCVINQLCEILEE